MKYIIIYISSIIFLFTFNKTADAQIGFAIALEENRSAIHWQMAKAESTSRANSKARNMLKDKGYEKVTTQPCKECGHTLNSGYWVVVSTSYKIYDGSIKNGFGLGISSISYNEAEQLALKNLGQYNWNWSRKKHSYSVNKTGTF